MADDMAGDAVAQAIDWHLRQPALDERGWIDFVAWLEVPAHAAAYDRVALADQGLGELTPPVVAPAPLAANDDEPSRRGTQRVARWGWSVGGLGIAAAIALLVMPMLTPSAHGTSWIETKPGENRTVALSDGTRIELNGGTRLGLPGPDTRVALLDRGEAVFHVTHDAARPFGVRSGTVSVEDVGTVFNVARVGAHLDVAVAEGGVVVDPAGARVALFPGQSVSVREDTHRMVRSTVATDLVGSWRGGRLAFADAPLGEVAAAVERRYGVDLDLRSGLSARPFTGMVAMSGTADRDIPHLAALIGAEWRHQGERWILVPAREPGR